MYVQYMGHSFVKMRKIDEKKKREKKKLGMILLHEFAHTIENHDSNIIQLKDVQQKKLNFWAAKLAKRQLIISNERKKKPNSLKYVPENNNVLKRNWSKSLLPID